MSYPTTTNPESTDTTDWVAKKILMLLSGSGGSTPGSSVGPLGGGGEYETVAASQTAQVLGGAGATGDYLNVVWIIPATTSPGNVIVLDGATSITVFTGGGSSVSNLVPFPVAIQARSVSGPWKVTTGSNVSVIASGLFT